MHFSVIWDNNKILMNNLYYSMTAASDMGLYDSLIDHTNQLNQDNFNPYQHGSGCTYHTHIHTHTHTLTQTHLHTHTHTINVHTYIHTTYAHTHNTCTHTQHL